jgi:hypothetical protein
VAVGGWPARRRGAEYKAGVSVRQAVVIDLLVAGSREFRRPGYRRDGRDGRLPGGFFRNTWVMLPMLLYSRVLRRARADVQEGCTGCRNPLFRFARDRWMIVKLC